MQDRSVADVEQGDCEVTRWQVLNLARVWLSPPVQFEHGMLTNPRRKADVEGINVFAHWRELLPGFTDRRGIWRSTLASTALRLLVERVGYEYLLRRPPCFPEEPFAVRWLRSYADTRLHNGTIYRAAGWEVFRANSEGIQTWRVRLPDLTSEQLVAIRKAAEWSPRSRRLRAERAVGQMEQLELCV